MSSAEQAQAASLQRGLLWRLVIGIGLLLGGLFVILELQLDHAMYRSLDRFLEARADAFAQQLQDTPHETEQLLAAYDLSGNTEYFAVYHADGRLRLKSGNSERGVLALPASSARNRHYDAALPDGHLGRAVATPLHDGGWLVLGTERESWDRIEREMHLVLLVGIALAIVLVVVLCLWAVRRAFGSMTAEGRRLSALSPQQAAQLQVDHLPRELQPYAGAVRDALARLHDALERERRFSRHVAHELRTPVAEVRLATENALREGSIEALQGGARATLGANARMERGIHALLALSRWESGLESPAPDPLDLVPLLRRAAADARALVPDAPPIQLQLPASAWVHSDTGMLERILANLLHNALDYGDPGKPVRLQLLLEADGYHVRIANAATGLGTADLARFGERYWRGEGRDGDRRHAGLGLALVQALTAALDMQVGFTLDQAELVAGFGPLPAL